MSSTASSLWLLPNQLTLLRLVLSVVLFVLIALEVWWGCLVVFVAAMLTDWLDGIIARRWKLGSKLGRNLDPLADKVLICGTFIFLIPAPWSGLQPWMVVIVVCRELAVTGLRSMFESEGVSFGADWAGKLKMVLQCATLVAVFLFAALHVYETGAWPAVGRDVLIYAMLLATVYSGLQYLVKAIKLTPKS